MEEILVEMFTRRGKWGVSVPRDAHYMTIKLKKFRWESRMAKKTEKEMTCNRCIFFAYFFLRNKAGIPRSVEYICLAKRTIVRCPDHRCMDYRKAQNKSVCQRIISEEMDEALSEMFTRPGKWGLKSFVRPFQFVALGSYWWESRMPPHIRRRKK